MARVQRSGHHLAQHLDEDVREFGLRQAMGASCSRHERAGCRLVPLGELQLFENLVQAGARLGATGEGEDAGGGKLGARRGAQRVVVRQLLALVGGEGGEAADAPIAGNGAGEPPVVQRRPRRRTRRRSKAVSAGLREVADGDGRLAVRAAGLASQLAQVVEQSVVVELGEVLLLRRHRVRLGLGRRVQQPGRSRGRGVAEGAPDEVAAVLGARQRHI